MVFSKTMVQPWYVTILWFLTRWILWFTMVDIYIYIYIFDGCCTMHSYGLWMLMVDMTTILTAAHRKPWDTTESSALWVVAQAEPAKLWLSSMSHGEPVGARIWVWEKPHDTVWWFVHIEKKTYDHQICVYFIGFFLVTLMWFWCNKRWGCDWEIPSDMRTGLINILQDF